MFNLLIVAQKGRLEYEALMCVASLRHCAPDFTGRVIVAEPQPGTKWPDDPRINDDVRTALTALGAEVVPFTNHHFGNEYPHGNKIEALTALPVDEPFLFLDSDTLITGDISRIKFDFKHPSASMRREGTWPQEELYWPGYTAIWKSLYDRFGLGFEGSLDLSQPDEYWERYLYFNAGWFFYRDPVAFHQRFLEYALTIRDNAPEELVIQPIYPWLDQIALPLVVHGLGGGRPGDELRGMDGDVTCHYRTLPLLYARESDRVVEVLETVTAPNKIKKVLKQYDPIKRMVFQKRGHKVRAMFDRENLPRREQKIRNQIKRAGFWMR